MKQWSRSVLMAVACLVIPGCGTTGTNPNPPTPPSPASIQMGAQALVASGLELGITFAPDKKADILKYAASAGASLKSDVIPWFTNTPLNQITAATAQDILSKFEGKIPGNIATLIGGAVALATTAFPFPKNPADGIDPNTQASILAGLNGAVAGIDQVEAANSSTAPPTAKAAKKIVIVTRK